QSPALRMIVEREEAIEAFKAQEYWSIAAQVSHEKQPFEAKLTRYAGKKVEQFSFTDGQTAEAVRSAIAQAANGTLTVHDVTSKQRQRRPAAPFITSTLQQEAARKLGFTTNRTMRTAQQLYEGVALGSEGQVGLITYMRTDATHLGVDAVQEIRDVIRQRYGAASLPAEPMVYRAKSKNAQEAHEAIRPTSAALAPDQVAAYLSPEQQKLYELIWKRTLACQMAPALLNTVAIDLAAGDAHMFRATGTTVVEPGFLAVYEEGRDVRTEEDEEQGRRLPALATGDRVPLAAIVADQHFTEPPPRFSEASLVKALEEYGIGRPSTYASIIQTLVSRQYVMLEQRRFRPTDVGRVVANFLGNHFTQYVDYDFTAKLEDELDAVSRGEEDWVPLMHKFWKPFKALVADKMETVTFDEAKASRQLGNDPKTGKPVSVRLGRYGPFASLGTKEDEDKPKFASLRPGQSLHTISLDDALALFQLPRKLGLAPDGEEIVANVGRFGPYVKHGPVYASLKPEDDPYTVDLARALAVLEEKRTAEANRIINRFDDGAIQVLNGRYGPYITDGTKNAKIPKDREPKTLTRDECAALLEAAPIKTGGGRFGRRGAKDAPAKKAGTKKSVSAKIPGGEAPAAKRPAAKKSAVKKAAKKKSAVKRTAAVRAATKTAATKPVARKSAAGKAAKAAVAKKTASRKPAAADDAPF
ncbi:MAG TPA: type I DNA topoisomerase, partial [Candidatus Saccharimonadia bacterium]|nr:type I DNA topoisomerase [Candidatus Saccharimonadia bacterium]